MPKTPRLKGKELIARLEEHGFRVVRVRGSHHFLAHFDGRCTVIPVHAGEIIGPGLMRKILRDTELSAMEI